MKYIFGNNCLNVYFPRFASITPKGDINIIKEKYKLAENVPEIGSVVGWIIKAIKKYYQPPKSKVKKGSFNDYEQRAYDFDELEKKLLGWDEKKENEVGEEYEQSMIEQ